MRTDAHALGLLTAIALAGMQALWSLLVATGAAQVLVDFTMRAWFVAPVLHILPFNLLHALVLTFAMAVIGYLIGWGVGVALNSAQRMSQ